MILRQNSEVKMFSKKTAVIHEQESWLERDPKARTKHRYYIS